MKLAAKKVRNRSSHLWQYDYCRCRVSLFLRSFCIVSCVITSGWNYEILSKDYENHYHVIWIFLWIPMLRKRINCEKYIEKKPRSVWILHCGFKIWNRSVFHEISNLMLIMIKNLPFKLDLLCCFGRKNFTVFLTIQVVSAPLLFVLLGCQAASLKLC